jgi:hypothetical protein
VRQCKSGFPCPENHLNLGTIMPYALLAPLSCQLPAKPLARAAGLPLRRPMRGLIPTRGLLALPPRFAALIAALLLSFFT